LKELPSLSLDGTEVTDAGLSALAGRNLPVLSIPKQAQTDLGLKNYLAAVRQAPSDLSLSGWRITDAGLKELAGLKHVHTLNLNNTLVTDAGLKHLIGLKQLRSLSLAGTKVTDRGVAELRKALPDLKVSRIVKEDPPA
jgi:hypothetical protein